MLSLVLLRHADARRDLPVADFDRPLSVRGLAEARSVAAQLAAAELRAARVLVSPALRTLTTARLYAERLGLPETALEPQQAIYEAPLNRLIVLLSAQGSDPLLVLCGHNPGLSELAAWLLGHGGLGALPTGAAVQLLLDLGQWKDVTAGCARLGARWWPRGRRRHLT